MTMIVPSLISSVIFRRQLEKKQGEEIKTIINIVLDEAHNILYKEDDLAVHNNLLEKFEKIVKEGRKFGVFLTVSSQRPSDISSTILSQLHNYFIHKLVNPNDLNQIRKAVAFLDENALKDVVDEAKKAGIVISAEAQPISNAQIDGSLDEYSIGYAIGSAAADWINMNLDGKGKALVLAQDDVEAVIRRGDGIVDGITENAPDSEIIARQNASNTDLGMKVSESVMLAHPEVNVVCACDDYTAIGAYEAIRAMGDIDENFYVGGCDATDEGKEKMKADNSIYRSSINLFPYDAGYEIAYAMFEYLTENQEDAVVERH